MAGKHEFLIRGGEVFLLDENSKTTSLAEAVGMLSMEVYANLIDIKNAEDVGEKQRLEEKIIFQSTVLDSLSNAHQTLKI